MKNTSSHSRGTQLFNFIEKTQIDVMNDGRHTRTSGTKKSSTDLTIVSLSSQLNLSWIVSHRIFDSEHCMTTAHF